MAEPLPPPPRSPVRIWAASDLHGIDPATLAVQPDGCDLAILAGDLCPLADMSIRAVNAQPAWMNVVLGEWVASRPETQFVAIPGDHDVFLKRRDKPVMRGTVPTARRGDVSLPQNFHLLIDEGVDVCGLRVYGTPWVPYVDGRWAFEANSEVRERQWFDCIPDGTDVLVSHAPPRFDGLDADVTLQFPTQRLRHYGSRPLAEAITRSRPALCVFGHVHSGDHSARRLECGTILRNASVLDEDFTVSYPPAIFTLTPRSH